METFTTAETKCLLTRKIICFEKDSCISQEGCSQVWRSAESVVVSVCAVCPYVAQRIPSNDVTSAEVNRKPGIPAVSGLVCSAVPSSGESP